jgi:hypothetical protein
MQTGEAIIEKLIIIHGGREVKYLSNRSGVKT